MITHKTLFYGVLFNKNYLSIITICALQARGYKTCFMLSSTADEKFELHRKFQKYQNSRNQRYRKVPKFSDARKRRCNLPKIQTKRPNLRVFLQKDANGVANSEDPDQTAPLGAV